MPETELKPIVENLKSACERYLNGLEEEPHAYFDAELEYCEDMIVDLASSFIRAKTGGEIITRG